MSKNISMEMIRIVGKTGKHLKCTLRQNGDKFNAIIFNADEIIPSIERNQLYQVVYTIEQNTWNGSTKTELRMIDIRPQL